MKGYKTVVILILVFALPAFFTACGNNETSSGQQTDAQQQSEAAEQSAIQAATDQTDVVTEAVQAADIKASADNLIGNWTDTSSSDRFAKITKTDTGYEYEDNEGKYPATFKDGILKVKASDSVTVDVYIDANTGNLLSVFDGNMSEFIKK